MDRNGDSYTVYVSACGKKNKYESSAATIMHQFTLMSAVIGADCVTNEYFFGLIGAFNWRVRLEKEN